MAEASINYRTAISHLAAQVAEFKTERARLDALITEGERALGLLPEEEAS